MIDKRGAGVVISVNGEGSRRGRPVLIMGCALRALRGHGGGGGR